MCCIDPAARRDARGNLLGPDGQVRYARSDSQSPPNCNQLVNDHTGDPNCSTRLMGVKCESIGTTGTTYEEERALALELGMPPATPLRIGHF
jgi:hypothetical protein